MEEKNQMPEEDIKKMLTPEQYHILREKGTESPFSGEYLNFHGEGMFKCVVCGAELFDAGDKFDSGTGWPSFDRPVANGKIKLITDTAGGMERTEVVCANCGSHLGHVFNDGPKETTGQRFCINSACLKLDKK